MQHIIDTITAYKGIAYRNIQHFFDDNQAFNDLTPNENARKFALESSLSLAEKSNFNSTNFNAIDYIFKLPAWEPSRFSDGSFPTWYGSATLETTFHESTFHWHRTFIQAPENYAKNKTPIIGKRSVYSVKCNALLIDLRDKTQLMPELINKDMNSYQKTQPIGKQIQEQGIPGIIALSSRHTPGENIIIFQPSVLQSAQHENDYLYTFYPQISKIEIHHINSGNVLYSFDV